MKIYLIKLGKTKYPEIISLVEIYKKRLKTFAPIHVIEIKEKDPPAFNAEIEKICQQSYVVILDEKGELLTSVELADQLKVMKNNPLVKSLAFIVGGPYGLPADAYRLSQKSISFSKMTFTSDHAWLLLWEQIYRANTILQGTSYHHA